MNILILTTKFPYPPRDGGAIATLNMATGLAENGCEVTLLAMNTTKHYFSPPDLPQSLHEKINFISIPVDTKIRWMALLLNFLFSTTPYNAIRFRSKDFLKKLQSLLEEQNFDIIQLEGPYLDYCLPVIRKRTGSRISFRAHNLEYQIWQRRARSSDNPVNRFYFNNLSQRIYQLEKNLLQEIDYLIPISDQDRNGLIEMGFNKPACTCPTGINLMEYTHKVVGETFSLFYIGALDWGPNTEGLDWFFKEVWPEVLQKNPGIDLHIAGRNSGYYFKKRRIPEHVIIHGEVEDAREYMNRYTIMIVPLLSGSGIRIKILEGMAMKKLIITTSLGAEGIPVTHEENILIADTPSDFINEITNLRNDPSRIPPVCENAWKLITEKFDNLVVSQRLTSFYKEQLK